MSAPPRVTSYPFPPYTYIPGRTPHPISDPQGHRCPGPDHCSVESIADEWRKSESYLWGFDLFNAQYFWEAHEAWEHVWLDAKREAESSSADWMKALIKLAAAGVKALEENPEGVTRHARRSAELIDNGAFPNPMCGIAPFDVKRLAGEALERPLLWIKFAHLIPRLRADSDWWMGGSPE